MIKAISAIFLVFTLAAPSGTAGKHSVSMADSSGRKPAVLLPGSGEVPGWKTDGETLTYEAENLWEYINGSAESFLAYDFEQVVAQDYMSGNGKSLKVEIYMHAEPLMAFGIYSQFREPGLDFPGIGNEGFGDGYSLHFWKGRYYVKIYVFEESEELGDAMKRFAALIGGRIEERGELPGVVDCFPEKGRIDGSMKYLTEGVLGSGKLPPAFVADYAVEEQKGKLYLFPMSGIAEAGKLFEWYAGETGAKRGEIEINGATYPLGVGEARYQGRMVFFSVRSVFGIVAGFGSKGEESSGKDSDKIPYGIARAAAGACADKD